MFKNKNGLFFLGLTVAFVILSLDVIAGLSFLITHELQSSIVIMLCLSSPLTIIAFSLISNGAFTVWRKKAALKHALKDVNFLGMVSNIYYGDPIGHIGASGSSKKEKIYNLSFSTKDLVFQAKAQASRPNSALKRWLYYTPASPTVDMRDRFEIQDEHIAVKYVDKPFSHADIALITKSIQLGSKHSRGKNIKSDFSLATYMLLLAGADNLVAKDEYFWQTNTDLTKAYLISGVEDNIEAFDTYSEVPAKWLLRANGYV